MLTTWLRPNRRAVLFGMLPPAAIGAMGLAMALGVWEAADTGVVRGVGWLLAAIAVPVVVGLLFQLRYPRIGYRNGHVVFNLRGGVPMVVPLEVVEAFLLGQGPSLLPGERHRHTQATTVVVRLAERAEAWAKVDVNPRLASWCDSYITIRGAWCERLDVEVVRRLNRLLAEANRAERGEDEGLAS